MIAAASLFIVAVFCCAAAVAVVAWRLTIWMPGRAYRGQIPPLDERGKAVRERLSRDLFYLADEIGPRNVSHSYDALVTAAEFLERSLGEAGLIVRRQEFVVDGQQVWNIDAELAGRERPEQILVVGAHYDTVPGSPGANDNGSAVVATLELARHFATRPLACTIRFALFVNEESPYYMTDGMGSLRYAQACQERGEQITGMISLETIGCYVGTPSTQSYPITLLSYLYPTTGDFAAVVGNLHSRRFVHDVVRVLRKHRFPFEGIAAPNALKDIFRSDHAAFWSCGFPGLMITDTANFRYPHYHTPEDTADEINFDALAALVIALEAGLEELLSPRE